MSISSSPSRERILDAALALFARHGFQRASMIDVARAAGVSRPALYLHFAGKPELFAAVAGKVRDDALRAGAGAWREEAELAANLAAAFTAKDLPLFRLLKASGVGEDLMGADRNLTRAIGADLDAGFAAQLAARFQRLLDQRRALLGPFDGADAFGEFAARAAAGLKHEARDEADLAWLAGLLARALAGACAPRPIL
jgi:AcrR family transcriptional regulator